jgi:CRISPR/Cas system CSM-associated protein Csm2 small subunit
VVLKRAEETLAAETGITKSLLQKIKNNPTLRKVFNVGALSVGLLFGTREEVEAQTANQAPLVDKTSERQTKEISEQLQNILESIPLYHELKEKGLNLHVEEDSALYEQGITRHLNPGKFICLRRDD